MPTTPQKTGQQKLDDFMAGFNERAQKIGDDVLATYAKNGWDPVNGGLIEKKRGPIEKLRNAASSVVERTSGSQNTTTQSTDARAAGDRKRAAQTQRTSSPHIQGQRSNNAASRKAPPTAQRSHTRAASPERNTSPTAQQPHHARTSSTIRQNTAPLNVADVTSSFRNQTAIKEAIEKKAKRANKPRNPGKSKSNTISSLRTGTYQNRIHTQELDDISERSNSSSHSR